MTENKIKPTMEQTIYCLKAESERYPEVCEECQLYGEVGCDHCYDDTNDMAIKFLKELEQYRAIGTVEHIQLTFELCKVLDAMTKMYEAIGTVEEFKALKEKQYNCTIKNLTNECSYKETGCSDCKGYWEIRKLLEKNVAKKSKEVHENEVCIDFICPNCKEAVYGQPYRPNYCKHCGQKLDWQ